MAKKKKVIETTIIDTMFPNKSVGKYEDKTVIFKGGIKGQKVKGLLDRKRKNHIE